MPTYRFYPGSPWYSPGLRSRIRALYDLLLRIRARIRRESFALVVVLGVADLLSGMIPVYHWWIVVQA